MPQIKHDPPETIDHGSIGGLTDDDHDTGANAYLTTGRHDADDHSGLATYDSGWFVVTTGNDYVVTHSLNSTKLLPTLYFAVSSTGGDMQVTNSPQSAGADPRTLNIHDVGSATCKVSFVTGYWYMTVGGGLVHADTGFARVMILKFV